ncbi:archease [Thermoleophilum album]|uniref:SHS2 domain-containing protein n=1 Tax=Thermoleophilum album TaxID=29539 RepID=A0A1H6FHC7_THEAL|nr:archease [Thermoleophilum album]SEH10216.1 SHS2 domain-containing protein [Thermoleophilum album]
MSDDPSLLSDDPSSAPPARHWFAEHTGELELEIEAPTLEAVFAQALRALAELLEGPGEERAGAPVLREVVIESSDRAALLADWLSELVYLADRDGFVPDAIEHIDVAERTLKATVRGHIGQPSSLVKAATYHRLELAPAGDRWRARVVLDV